MKLLAFDTSTEQMSIAVGVSGGVGAAADAAGWQVWRHQGEGGAQASAHLIDRAMALLAEAGLELAALDAICFGCGPGSFTGLRTACAVAQGLAYGVDLPVLPVDSLLALAEAARMAQCPDATEVQVLALLDARMDEIYTGRYHYRDSGPVASTGPATPAAGHWQVLAPAALVQPHDVAGLAKAALPDGPLLLAGNAMAVYAEAMQLDTQLPGVPRQHAVPLAEAMLRLAPDLLAVGAAVAAAQALPVYVRDKVAQTTAERMALKHVPSPATGS